MDLLPTEIIFQITDLLPKSDICSLRCLNKRIDGICQNILFKAPNFKHRVPISDVSHLPIEVLTTCQLLGPILDLPDSLQVFIVDSRITIDPQIIKSRPEIEFIFSLNSIREPIAYHLSNYLLDNVKVFTTAKCPIRFNFLSTFKDFQFKQITLSHIETWTDSYEDDSPPFFEPLFHLNIERLVLDSTGIISGVISRGLLSLQNIVYISSNIFNRNTIFPLTICLGIKTLEILHFERNTRFSVSERKYLYDLHY